MDVARVLQRVASLALNYKYPNPFSVRDTTIFVIFFQSFFRKPKLIFLSKLVSPSPVLGCFQGTLRGCES